MPMIIVVTMIIAAKSADSFFFNIYHLAFSLFLLFYFVVSDPIGVVTRMKIS
jgi:hypothetical protein